jgi:flavin reductase (DIM6/NTAB) family NADH-FMN oxidoreductase RutF
LKGAVGTIECQLVDEIERYNSVIAIGQIVNSVSDESKRPLVYFSGAVLD